MQLSEQIGLKHKICSRFAMIRGARALALAMVLVAFSMCFASQSAYADNMTIQVPEALARFVPSSVCSLKTSGDVVEPADQERLPDDSPPVDGLPGGGIAPDDEKAAVQQDANRGSSATLRVDAASEGLEVLGTLGTDGASFDGITDEDGAAGEGSKADDAGEAGKDGEVGGSGAADRCALNSSDASNLALDTLVSTESTLEYWIPVDDEATGEYSVGNLEALDSPEFESFAIDGVSASSDSVFPIDYRATSGSTDGLSYSSSGILTVSSSLSNKMPTQSKKSAKSKTFKVRFYDAFGNVAKIQSVRKGKNATAPKLKSMRGRSFKRWDTKFKKVKSNLYVYPIFKDRRDIYILAIDSSRAPNSVSTTTSSASSISWTRWKAGMTIVAGDARYGLAASDGVVGWRTKPNSRGVLYSLGDTIIIPKHDLVLYPVYSYKNSTRRYTVTYNSNRDGVVSTKIELPVGSYAQIPSTLIQMSGYSMIGYSTKRKGGGTLYALGSRFKMPKRNMTLYGVWRENSIRVRVMAGYSGDEAVPETFFVPSGASIPISNFAIARSGSANSKKSWRLDSLSTEKRGAGEVYDVYGASQNPYSAVYLETKNQDITLHANWRKVGFKVRIGANGGSYAPDPDSAIGEYAAKGDIVTLPDSSHFAREGRFLVGFSTKKAGKVKYLPGQSVVVKKNVKLKAIWSKISKCVKVVFDPGCLGVEPKSVEAVAGAELTVSPEGFPARVGYTLAGWASSSRGVTSCAPGGTWIVPRGNVTMRAIWHKTAVVSFVGNYSSAGSAHVRNCEPGEVYLDCPIARMGYAFSGWSAKPDGTGKAYSSVSRIKVTRLKPVVLYAQWKKRGVTLKLDKNLGDDSASNSDRDLVRVAAGMKLGNNYNSQADGGTYFNSYDSRAGYTFVGWDTKRNGSGKRYGSSIDFDNLKLRANTTLYAQWKKSPKVVYRSGSEKCARWGNVETDSDMGFSNKGKVLIGWSEEGGSGNRTYQVGEKVHGLLPSKLTLRAQWEKPLQKIKFTSRGTVLKTVKAVGGRFNHLPITVSVPRRKGYCFDGWSVLPAGKRTTRLGVYRGDEHGCICGETWVPRAGLRLRARWEKTSTVTLSYNDGVTASVTLTKSVKCSSYGAVYLGGYAPPSRAGYEFLGWSAENGSVDFEYSPSSWYDFDPTNTPVATKLYAVWTQA